MNTLLAVKLEEFWGSAPAKGALTESPSDLISSILPNIYTVASLILLIYAVAGGFIFITAAGNTEQAGKGKQIITNALIGFLIIFASYWIIQAVTVITGVPILG